jgi:hypothetical protein
VFFLDPSNGGAWPLLVGGVICLVDSVNGRDPSCPVGTRIAHILCRRQKAALADSNLFASFGWRESPSVGSFSAGFLALRKVRFWATAGL